MKITIKGTRQVISKDKANYNNKPYKTSEVAKVIVILTDGTRLESTGYSYKHHNNKVDVTINTLTKVK